MMFYDYLSVFTTGIATGFIIGFISWGLGLAVYSIMKWFKM